MCALSIVVTFQKPGVFSTSGEKGGPGGWGWGVRPTTQLSPKARVVLKIATD
jgi:hypothetical protein